MQNKIFNAMIPMLGQKVQSEQKFGPKIVQYDKTLRSFLVTLLLLNERKCKNMQICMKIMERSAVNGRICSAAAGYY